MDDLPQPLACDDEAVADAEIVFTPRELEMIAEAEASLAQGLYVNDEEVHAWVASLGTERELPVPPVRQRG